MLDAETKRRIDTARDILVGKVPDPKSQVEQITIALIYKFMDDMDAESEELGGNRKFFAGEFAQYGWPKLVRSGLGGHEVLNLYSEAITRMPENPGIPPLFRDIFKNAFLPYRDPETLRAFLKIIDEFEYDHSERLGDAFEYLLSVLGSQGDAGQFRTPRHIIDFIVSIVGPKKDETILDPACGTAGFLISSYKHILKSNIDEKGHIMLTPDEKGKLADSFKGYDISPDMVRLSLVNLYLHGFVAPQVYEYDTLTSEDRWNEHADVILANPPFMSPKGGIRPHNRFSVKSKRSEVLFVDYMAEHLTPNGRAGIIVPEGIIFQSQNAYKQLRMMLVEKYLVAVISLPAGVFSPYSGVKTSILILDKALAQCRDSIGFFKVENDGFDLGAQRREIDENDLPQTEQAVIEHLNTDEQDIQHKDSSESMLIKLTRQGSVQIVAKEKIAANGEYNLSRERYRAETVRSSCYEMIPFVKVCTLEYGASLPKKNRVEGPYPVMGSNGISGYHNEYLIKGPAIIVGRKGSAGEVTYINSDCFPIDTTYYVKIVDPNRTEILYLYHLLKTLNLPTLRGGAGIPGLNRNEVYEKYVLPLPPLQVQREIVAEIEGYQKVIVGARAVVENYHPHITIDPDWPTVKLNKICTDFKNGANFSKDQMGHGTRFVNVKDLFSPGIIDLTKLERVELTESEVERKKLEPNDLLFVRSSVKEEGVGYPSLMAAANEPIVFCGFIIKCSPNKDIASPAYLLHLLRTTDFRAKVVSLSNRANITNISQDSLKTLEVPLPPLETQQAIVAEIEAEQSLVSANQELIARMERKIQATISFVWGKDKVEGS